MLVHSICRDQSQPAIYSRTHDAGASRCIILLPSTPIQTELYMLDRPQSSLMTGSPAFSLGYWFFACMRSTTVHAGTGSQRVPHPYVVHRVGCCSTSMRALRYVLSATSSFSSCLSIEVCPRSYWAEGGTDLCIL
ncbi:hypothetical protein DFH06DRAFT_1471127 [Mycena polygramma]|nr:hypothetical protein DFH06DRAFT_1471127 [Mycena polygramma]